MISVNRRPFEIFFSYSQKDQRLRDQLETQLSLLIGKLNPLPTGGKPVVRWTDRDSAFLDIAQGIRKVIEEIATGL